MRRDNCLECGVDIDRRERPKSEFCCDAHGSRHRDRLRYQADPEKERARARAYYAANRERVIERVRRSR